MSEVKEGPSVKSGTVSLGPTTTPVDTKYEEQLLAKFRLKKLLTRLEAARGEGTSLISLLIPP